MRPRDDGLAPARGLCLGCVLSALAWLAIVAAFVIGTRIAGGGRF